MEKELSAARKQLDEEEEEELQELYDLQDNLEQYSRKNSLEFRVPKSAFSSTEEAVIKIANAVDVPVVTEDIEISHKLSTRGFLN